MSEQCMDALRCNPGDLHQAMSIHTRKITDACRDKDCIEDLRVYLTCCGQEALEGCSNPKVRTAELLHTRMEVEPVAFDRNHYCIDVTFYYRITVDLCGQPFVGLAVFSKRVVLCGEDAAAHIFRSDGSESLADAPIAVVEVLDPMVLSFRVRDRCECDCKCDCDREILLPDAIRSLFGDSLAMGYERRRLYVTLGQFSIIRLERDAQLIVPILDYCIPSRECCDSSGGSEDPCELFSKIPFPTQQFNPRGCEDKKLR